MTKLLYISYCAPYDGVRHAGGKTHNYYLKEIAKNENIDHLLLTFVANDEVNKIDLESYGINHELIYYPRTSKEKIISKIMNFESKFNPFNRNGSFVSNYESIAIRKRLSKLKEKGYRPDVILLEWTQILFHLPFIKKCFPNAKVFTIEEDVAFLGKMREAEKETKIFRRLIKYHKTNVQKKLEIEYLNNVDLVFTTNTKDKDILINNHVNSPIDILTPYFDDYRSCVYNPQGKDIVFFGAMDRPENNLSALWFIDNVMPLLSKDYRYVVVGNKPSAELRHRANDRIIITGFVDDISTYFEKSLCFVSSLLLGAGIKVKVIEAMSSGIPVICNDISIEGIQCKDKEDFILCREIEDYVSAIKDVSRIEYAKKIGNNGKAFIENNFNYMSDCIKLQQMIISYDNCSWKVCGDK